ncbi:MAG: M23 family metallopeptidase [Candidatus Omnitrophica bacterium]|nr:M23 family metallopeptidase [Candidatus Omnitrophota bacterium]MBU1906386.1 M23 family metallopeptidase [Candidatus Omnitrophota bacterium]
MKRAFLIILIILLAILIPGIYFLDKQYCLCPIEYEQDIIVLRHDKMGDGSFGASRSGNRKHLGVDLLAEVGTPVRAVRSGIVLAEEERRGMGKYVVIKHLGGIKTIYGHLSKIRVAKYQLVRQGQIIGDVGKTGNANYRSMLSHLHLEVRKNNIPQDPLEYLE